MTKSKKTLNIGLLMTYNEADIIAEMMAVNAPMVDAIFVLDGSDDGTAEILSGYDIVKSIQYDADVLAKTAGSHQPEKQVRDYHRQVLLEAARAKYGLGHWYTLMHGDELFYNDAREAIARAESYGAKRINWAAMQFFLHPEDRNIFVGKSSLPPVQERLKWYSPLWLEIRQFKDGKDGTDNLPRYRTGEHGRVLPHGVGWLPNWRVPIFKHYPYRSPAQVAARMDVVMARGFSATFTHNLAPSQQVAPDVFRTIYASEYKTAHRFTGDFGKYENQSLPVMMWYWRRLVKR